ncbi:hypothetical protein ABTM58_21020, partial [Acinetobacter baumannii]
MPVYDNGFYTRIDNPLRQPVYNLGVESVVRNVNDNVTLVANANQSSTIKLYFNGILASTTTAATNASTVVTIT